MLITTIDMAVTSACAYTNRYLLLKGTIGKWYVRAKIASAEQLIKDLERHMLYQQGLLNRQRIRLVQAKQSILKG